MTTSGTTAFVPNRDQVVRGALRLVGAYASTDNPRPEQVTDAVEALNMMLKNWQKDGCLWLKHFIYVAMAAATASYVIGPGSSATVTSDAAAAIPYTQRPIRVYTPRRRIKATGVEVPLSEPMSRTDYSNLPNKATPGTPVQVYYDPQLLTGTLFVWPVPTGATEQIVCTVDRIIEDASIDENTFDVPVEWVRVVKWNLAKEIMIEYGLSASDRKGIQDQADYLKQNMEAWNTDTGSTFFQPG